MTGKDQDTLLLLRTRLSKLGINGVINPMAQTLCSIIDHFNRLHWYDRNHWADQVAALRKEHDDLKSRVFRLETKGNQE